MRVFLLFVFSIVYGLSALAEHFIGADMTYTCLGNNQYLVTTTVYRDCGGTGPPLEDSYDINVYNLVTGNFVENFAITHDGITTIEGVTDDPCVELPSSLCLEKAVYTGVIQLNPSLDGYFMNFNDCCFTSNVNNIPSGSLSVSTIIPPVTSLPCTDSPVFNEEPPLALCLFEDLSLDLGATWADYPSATLIYSFYTPENNGDGPPPYVGVTWLAGFSATNAIPTNSDLAINQFTGEITGTPTQLGFYLMGVEVFAIEDGDTIAEINRVFRYTVADCNVNRSLAELAEEPVCGDLIVEFANGSFGADDYEWNFDDIDSPDNISSEESPTHTFSDFGTYNVRLITSAGGSIECADTSFLEVILEDGADSEISVNNDYQCLAANSFDFQSNTSKPGATYLWEFGPNANNPTSTQDHPTGITFNQVGVYTVTLHTYYLECEATTTINVEVFEGILSEFTGPTEGCIPFVSTFEATVLNPNYTYEWTINGETLLGPSINYTFVTEGVYDIELYVLDENGCESTVTELDFITVDAEPKTGFEISDQYISAGDFVTIENSILNPKYKVLFTIPEYEHKASTKSNFVYTFEEEGIFEITQTVINGTCSDELTKLIHVGPPRIVVPNVFTPNGDLTNDFFYINPHYNSNIEIFIYNRWGLEVFSSSNYELCNPESGEFCWDGRDKNGQMCLEGAYAYLIVLPNGYIAKGFVQLFD